MTEKDNLSNVPETAVASDMSEHSHHHSEHSHHRHHSSRRRHKRKPICRRREKFKNFFKYNKHYLIYATMTIVFVVCLALLGGQLDKQANHSTQDDLSQDSVDSGLEMATDEIQINISFFTNEVAVVSSVVQEFMKLDMDTPVKSFVDRYKSANSRLDISLPVELKYELIGLSGGDYVQSAEFVVADNPGFAYPQILTTRGYHKKAEFYNLKTSTQYYYQINFVLASGATMSVSGNFKTGSGPRLLMVDGVRNIRDFGGWPTVDGNVVKQGLLYRGRELDGAVESTYRITSEGLQTMLTVLGIKMDMDLRSPGDNLYGIEALGSSVKHKYYSAPMYSNIFNGPENAEKIRQIFSDLANPDNYPIYLHCTYGQDRTGTVCYLLGALLGVDATSLAKEYQLSALCYGDVDTEAFEDFILCVMELPGFQLSAKVEGYLLSIGVTQDEIACIRQIFLEN